MSTSYAVAIDHHYPAQLAKIEWHPLPSTDGRVWSDGENFAHVDYVDDCILFATRYGRNDISDLTDWLGMVSEHDEEFESIVESACPAE